jgi:hypothetical protein
MPAPAFTQTPLTELDAVNQLLMSIGQSPVNTLVTGGISDVANAQLTLHNTTRAVLSKGYVCNTDELYPLVPDMNGKIGYPSNALSVDTNDARYDLVLRKDPSDQALRLYDRKAFTFVINKTIKVTVKWFLTFEELPASLRTYITARAGRVFQANAIGSQILYAYTQAVEAEAMADVQREEIETGNNNMFDSDPQTAFIRYRDGAYQTTLRG